MDLPELADQQKYIHRLCADTGCRLDKETDSIRERKREIKKERKKKEIDWYSKEGSREVER